MADQPRDQPPERLRKPPAERFAGESHPLDPAAVLRQLRGEDWPAHAGHRQVTLFQRPPVTTVLFSFDAGGSLPEHHAPGLVSIHVLDGRLNVRAHAQEHQVPAGQILILNPGVPHSVHAPVPAAMLLTVHLDEKAP